jgi:hypothetical protein
MDTLIVALNETTKSIDWILPLIAIVVQVVAIFFIVRNTNKQIKNQNKESHRPYLRVINFEEVEEEFMNSYLAVKNNEDTRNEVKTIHGEVWIRNLGYGTATNIFLLGFDKTVCTKAGIEEKVKTGETFSVLDLGLSENKAIETSLRSNNNSSDTTYDFMLFYTDLNKNIYSTMLLIQVKNNKFWNLYYYPHGSLNFDDILEKRNVEYRDLEKEYIKWELNKKP